MQDFESKIRAMHLRASHPETPGPEADNCRLLIASMAQKYGLDLDAIIAGVATEEVVELAVRWSNRYEKTVAIHLGQHLGMDVYTYRGSRGRKLKKVTCEGPVSVVEGWVALCAFHFESAEKLLTATLTGFLHGAAPLPPRGEDSGENRGEVDPDEMEMMVMGYEQGLRSRSKGSLALPERT